MNTFWILVKFEYLKILKKKSVLIAIFLGVLMLILSCWGTLLGNTYLDGKPFETNYNAMVKDREYARSLSGRTIDSKLLLEAASAYATIPKNVTSYISTDEYQKNARLYSEIYRLAIRVYSTPNIPFDRERMGNLTLNQTERFYELRNKKIEQQITTSLMSKKAKTIAQKKANEVLTPFTFSYTDGYGRFFTILFSATSLISAFIMAICIAPIFAGEYTSKMDQLILSSKHGKGTLIKAKLFTGFSFAAIFSLVLTIISYFQCMLTFGFDGGNSPVQIYNMLCIYSLTLKETALLQSICVFFSCIFTSAITMLLSAKLKSPFGVIILIALLLFVPIMISTPDNPFIASQLFKLLPSNMPIFWNIISIDQYHFFGLVIPPYIMIPTFAIICSILLTALTFLAFKQHQLS